MQDRQWQQGPDQARVSRRGFNRLTGGVLATLAFAAGRAVREGHARNVGAQTDVAATPPARPVEQGLSGYGTTIASKAAELDYDLERIARFVTEEIRYEPYAGALRGANVTLWGLAGNSVDQSLLLSALLTEAQITWRFAAGSLDDAAVDALLSRANSGIATVADSWGKAVDASLKRTTPAGTLPGATPVADDDPEDVDEALVADVVARATFAAKTGEDRFSQLAGQLAKALDDAGLAITPAGKTVLPDIERSRHCWVQVADGPRWIDVAPSLPATASKAMPKPSETFATIPDDLMHTVSVRITAETLSGSSLLTSDVATAQMSSIDAARAPVEIGVAPPQAMAAAGFAISEAVGGTSAMVPYLAAGNAILQAASNPVPFSSGGGALDVLGAATPAAGSCSCHDGDLIALSYTVDIVSPGAEPVSVQRYLLDHLTPEARATAASGVDLAAIVPLDLVNLSDGVTMPAELTASTFLTITTGDIPAFYGLQASGPDLAMNGLASIGGSRAGLAAAYGLTKVLPEGAHAFVPVPQAVAFSVGSVAGKEDGNLLLRGDLLHQGKSTLAGSDGITVSGLHPLTASGILGQVAEDVVIAPAFLMGTADAPVEQGLSVGSVFAAATEQQVRILALDAPNASAIPGGLATDVSARITTALDAGKAVVIPEKPVQLGGQSAIGWWEIDLQTGQTVDVYANGMGYVETRGPAISTRAQDAAEEAAILKEVNTWRPWYQRLGRCVGAAAMVAGSAIDPTTFNPGSGSAEGAVKAGIKILTRNPKILNDLKNLANCY